MYVNFRFSPQYWKKLTIVYSHIMPIQKKNHSGQSEITLTKKCITFLSKSQ